MHNKYITIKIYLGNVILQFWVLIHHNLTEALSKFKHVRQNFFSSKTIGISSFWGCKTMKYNHIWKTSMFMLCLAHFRWINNITHTYFQIIDRIKWRKQHELGAKSCEIFWNNVCLNINYRVCIYWVWLSNKPPSWDGISSGSLLLFVVC